MRIAALISAFYYFVITVGISISLHFCKGELTCFSFISENSMCCHIHEDDAAELESTLTVCDDNCCSTENVNITLDTDFTFESVDIPNIAISPSGEVVYVHPLVDTQTLKKDAPTRGSPESRPLYLVHSSFVFYG